MDLKELLGENYREDMTAEEVKDFFKKQVLSTGEYTNTGKAKAEQKELSDKIAELQAQLDAKMTDDDKKKKAEADSKKLIENLQKQLKESNIQNSRGKALGYLSGIKDKAGIKDKDTDFDNFISSIAFEDGDKTEGISQYISKIVENAYETGKNDAIKDKLGKMGSFKGGQEGSAETDKGAFGKELAQSTKVDTTQAKDFFKKN